MSVVVFLRFKFSFEQILCLTIFSSFPVMRNPSFVFLIRLVEVRSSNHHNVCTLLARKSVASWGNSACTLMSVLFLAMTLDVCLLKGYTQQDASGIDPLAGLGLLAYSIKVVLKRIIVIFNLSP